MIPFLEIAIDPIPGFLTRLAVLLSLFVAVDRLTIGWTRLRIPVAAGLALVGIVASGPPAGGDVRGWLIAAAVTATALVIVYVALLRVDLSMTPLILGTAAALGAVARGAPRPFPGALLATLVAAALTGAVAWVWFRVLRRGA